MVDQFDRRSSTTLWESLIQKNIISSHRDIAVVRPKNSPSLASTDLPTQKRVDEQSIDMRPDQLEYCQLPTQLQITEQGQATLRRSVISEWNLAPNQIYHRRRKPERASASHCALDCDTCESRAEHETPLVVSQALHPSAVKSQPGRSWQYRNCSLAHRTGMSCTRQSKEYRNDHPGIRKSVSD